MISNIRKNLVNILKAFMWKMPAAIVLMFHHVTDKPESQKSGCLLNTNIFYNIVSKFDAFISCEELINIKSKRYGRKTAITFDDGLIDIYTVAYPYLKQNNIPFTVFIVNDFLDTEGYISTEQLIEMSKDPLVSIGAHGLSHKVLTGLPSDLKWKEIIESKSGLEKLINKEVGLFAYSHGQYDGECLQMVKKAGYTCAFGVRGLPFNLLTKNWTFHFPRFNVVNVDIEKIESIANRLKQK